MKKATHRLTTERDRQNAASMLSGFCLDGKNYVVTIKETKLTRKDSQNRLSHVWYGQISKERGYKKTEAHTLCKLEFGIPIMKRDFDGFATHWAELERNLSYEQILYQVKLMDVTSILGVKQMAEYLTDMQTHWAEEGIILTSNEDLYLEAMNSTLNTEEWRKTNKTQTIPQSAGAR